MTFSSGYKLSDWDDDDKMSFLFSPFKDRILNAHSWDLKMDFWKNAIVEKLKTEKKVSFTLDSLCQLFKRQGVTPKCFQSVLENMLESKKLESMASFKSKYTNSWLYWGFNAFLSTPVSWTYKNLGFANTEIVSSEVMILPDLLKTYSKQFLSALENSVEDEFDIIFELPRIKTLFSELKFNQDSLDLILWFLVQNKQVETVNKSSDTSKDTIYYKLLTTIKNPKNSKVHESLFQIKKTMANLEAEIESIHATIESKDQKVRACLRNKSQAEALQQLKLKKKQEILLMKRENALDNLRMLRDNILFSSSEKEIIEAYEVGVKAYKGHNEAHGINISRIDETMDSVQDLFDTTDEINQAISQPVGNLNVSDEDLEAELENLVAGGAGPKGGSFEAADIIDQLNKLQLPEDDLPEARTTVPTWPISSES